MFLTKRILGYGSDTGLSPENTQILEEAYYHERIYSFSAAIERYLWLLSRNIPETIRVIVQLHLAYCVLETAQYEDSLHLSEYLVNQAQIDEVRETAISMHDFSGGRGHLVSH